MANTLQVPFASRYAAANASSNLIATSDGASWTNLNGSSIATGTVADARIDSALARLASPTFTGDPKAPTASPGDNDTSIASTAFVTAAVAAGGGSGGTGTVVTASGGSDMSRANITTNGFGLLVTQSGTNILLSTTNNYPTDYYAGGFLPLFAGLSNALTGDLHYKQSSDIRSPMWESGTAWNAMGMRASGGVWSVAEYNTNDFSVLESFITIDPTDLTGPTDIITFPNSGFNNKVVFEADVELNGNVIAATQTLGTSNTTVATTAFVKQNAGGSGSDTNWNGNPIASGTITNLTVSSINRSSYLNTENGDAFADGDNYGTFPEIFYPNWYGVALDSGSPGTQTGTTNNPSILPITSSASANSGYCYMSGLTSEDIAGGGKEFYTTIAIALTNSVVGRFGFQDTTTATEPADGAYIRLANGFVYGVLRNNSSETATTTSNQIAPSSTVFYRAMTRVNTDQASVTFWLLTATSPGVFTTNWTASVTNTLPSGSSRLTGHGIMAYHTAGSAGTTLILLDNLRKRNLNNLTR